MSVTIATKVFGSEATVALIRYYTATPATMNQAAAALDVPRHLVNRHTKLLVDAGVLTVVESGAGPYGTKYAVDEERVRVLLDALRRYCSNEDLQD